MFKEILEVWKKKDLLNQSREIVQEMFDLNEKMFVEATQGLSENAKALHLKELDQQVNQMQVDVRRKVLEHLSVSPKQDMVESMILLQVVIDLERIGDFCKNIEEINFYYKKKLKESKYFNELDKFRQQTLKNFALARSAFIDCDTQKAKKVLKTHGKLKDELDEFIFSKLEKAFKDSREAVAIALYIRFVKRINSHLQHIASTVTNPFERIGFASGKKLVDD